MSEESKKDEKKKDLTGIHDLPSLEPSSENPETSEDPFAVNVSQPIEQIDSFESIDQIGMMEHPQDLPPEPALPAEEPFAFNNDFRPGHGEANDPTSEMTALDPFLEPRASGKTEIDFEAQAPEPVLHDSLNEIKSYSERTQIAPFDAGTRVPFTLQIHGAFDPYARDKLLLFINDNPIGLNSADLDLQINGKRVLLPRISEFAGIKLIQDLRDTGLSFRLLPSSQDADETIGIEKNNAYHFSATPDLESSSSEMPVLPEASINPNDWAVIDSVEMVQYLRAEILEVEKSELFQELIDRMLDSLKRKAKFKGADAVTALTRTLKPMRLPSQYQVELKATLIKRR